MAKKSLAGSTPTLSGQDPASTELTSDLTLPEFDTTYYSTDHAATKEIHELKSVDMVLPQFRSESQVFDPGITEQKFACEGSGRGEGMGNPVGLPANILTGIPASPIKVFWQVGKPDQLGRRKL